VSVTLIERSFVCETGGGFETQRWSVRVNDGWLPVPTLVQRGSVGDIRVAVLDEDDPDGVAARGKWEDRAPQVWFKRSTRLLAPVGTGLWRRTWRPLIDPKRILEYPLPQRVSDEEFELCGEERYVPVRVLAQRRAEREAQARTPERALTKEETRSYLRALVSTLEETPAAEPTVAGETAPSAPVESDAPRVRRAPVRALSLPEEPALEKAPGRSTPRSR
jgi:hypothetical protein